MRTAVLGLLLAPLGLFAQRFRTPQGPSRRLVYRRHMGRADGDHRYEGAHRRLVADEHRPQHLLRPPEVGTAAGPGVRLSAAGHSLTLAGVASLVMLATGSAIWVRSLSALHLGDVGDVGLLSVLPPTYWVAVALLLCGCALAIWGRTCSTSLAAANVAALVIALHGVVAATSPYPRGTVSWRHIGIAAELAQSGHVNANIDAYFGWPGFFALLASFTGMSHLTDAQSLMKWAPVVNELLFLIPMLVLFSALTRDKRQRWSAVVVFYLANWIDQDYLSPQALGFLFYLCVLGLLLTFFRPGRAAQDRHPSPPDREDLDAVTVWTDVGGARRASVLAVVVVLIAATVTEHQLTPFALLLALGALALGRQCTVRGLPLLTFVLITAWITFAATPYLQGHLGSLIQQVGDLAGSTQGNLVNRVAGSHGHLVVVRGRILFSALLWGLACLGALRQMRRGQRRTAAAALLLCFAPALLFALQSYGGEVLLRVFLFSLPPTCLLAASLLPGSTSVRARRWSGAVFLLATVLLAPAAILVHYGNESIDQRSRDEVAAIRALYARAAPGTLLVAGNDNTPWRDEEYADHRHKSLGMLFGKTVPADPAAVERDLYSQLSRDNGYLLLTGEQLTYERLLGRKGSYTLSDVQAALLARGRFEVVYRNPDAVILVPKKKGAA